MRFGGKERLVPTGRSFPPNHVPLLIICTPCTWGYAAVGGYNPMTCMSLRALVEVATPGRSW